MSDPFETKPIPLITWRNMAPPVTSHCYFQHSEAFPFEGHAERFSLVNAWWLSESALLSYAAEEFARPWFEKAGFDDLWFFSGHSTQCYAAVAQDTVMVAFRGTECDLGRGLDALAQFIADLCVDVDIRWAEAEGRGRIHRGFRDALDEIWPDLQVCLDRERAKGSSLWITGHSLGGALALLAADRLCDIYKVQGVYTFGAPRIGDKRFSSGFAPRTFRIVNNNDVVPHLPPFPYADLGELHYIDSGGTVQKNIGRRQRWMDEIQGRSRCLMENLRHWRHDLAACLPEGFRDHTPLLYALHIWNNLVGYASQ